MADQQKQMGVHGSLVCDDPGSCRGFIPCLQCSHSPLHQNIHQPAYLSVLHGLLILLRKHNISFLHWNLPALKKRSQFKNSP